ncbi:SpaH/EbpB family LPXTG-anchored major pilin [Butyrivibrio sp. AE2032]|uniref:SpaH/EbpB family LPXTG-anchored major pilin n=1 Tax=Butyrivibrio sp. AE2032 TaxID=1458463 RepID=UPI000555126E|nr:SpaH/EbpB family LPXTG-anchored major pilin [Butyrivibrio sp. AE2032]
MTKTMKKITSVFIAFVMIMAMGLSAFAAGPYTITIKKKDTTDNSKHTYEVYQIFKGDVTTDGKLYNVTWGDNVDTSDMNALLNAVSGATALNKTPACADVDEVLDALKDLENDSAPLDGFAKVISGYLTGSPEEATLNANAAQTTVSVDDSGYYMVVDTITVDGKPSAISKFMLRVVGNESITINTKEEIPTLDKIIESATVNANITADGKKNTASVGDDINYKISTAIPDLRGKGYTDKYCFVVNDELSAGLTYKGDSAPTITIATSPVTTLTEGATGDFTFSKTVNGDGTTSLQIVFDAAKMLAKGISDDFAGKAMTITYTATLNDKAVVTDAGNPNTANLVYSNSPYQDYSGNVPTNNEPHGQTPDSKTITYTTQVELKKVDANDTTKTLAGAEFQITGLSSNVVVTTAQRYVLDNTNGTYYRLKDGTYTTEAPDGTNDDLYDTGKYKLDMVTEKEELEGTETVVDFEVGENGLIDLSRLGAGTYKIKETKAPKGYVKSDVEHTLVIACNLSGSTPVWTYTFDNTDITATPISIMIVDNMKTSDLPITGGMGTTLFYVAGTVLMLAGVSLLIYKKKSVNKG